GSGPRRPRADGGHDRRVSADHPRLGLTGHRTAPDPITGTGGRSMPAGRLQFCLSIPKRSSAIVHSHSVDVSPSAHRTALELAIRKEGEPRVRTVKKRSPKRPRLIEIQYLDLDQEPRDGGKPYVYTWALKE